MKKVIFRILGVVSAFFGILVLAYVLYPILAYEEQGNIYSSYLSPIPKSDEMVVRQVKNPLDFTRASNWFVGGANPNDFSSPNISYYTLSIPALKISSASVKIGGEDLSKSLIQYPGTALPGRTGNAVIFGHSILPQFFNPDDYMAIFSTLPTLNKGEEIYVDYDGISYKYKVEDKFEVLPTDLEVLSQPTNDAYISLITCVPPGHPLKPRRLVIKARLVPLNTQNENSRN